MMRNRNTSLWWRLSWQLSLVITAIVALVTLGLSLYGALTLSPNLALEHRVTAAMKEAVALDPQGRIEIRETPRLLSIKDHTRGFWYVVSTPNGDIFSYGDIPKKYTDLVPYINLFHNADIRGGDANGIASVETINTEAGIIKLIVGQKSAADYVIFTLLVSLSPIYIPLISLALPAIFIVVPLVVRRALAGVKDVAREATAIELRRQGTRLSTGGIPKEIAPLVIAFNGVLDRLEHQFQARQRFLVDAAHELRTPIAIMQTRIEGMSEGQDRRRLLDDVARLGDAAEQLLDFERHDQATDIQETVDLVDITRTVVADLAPLAIAAGYEISFHSEVEKLERRGSPTALPRAVINVVRNAIDHGGNAGTIAVTVSASGEIAVADQGGGIAPDQQELVFEPFYRVMPRSKGAGLGLPLVKQIISSHQGRVTIESGSTGTKFKLQL
ncbi:HAMP domain-containing sensor histidine kinase [Xanthobacter autotrophicus]